MYTRKKNYQEKKKLAFTALDLWQDGRGDTQNAD